MRKNHRTALVILMTAIQMIAASPRLSIGTAAAQCGIENTAFKSGEFLYYDLFFNWKFIWM